MCIEVIVCYIIVVFLRHSVYSHSGKFTVWAKIVTHINQWIKEQCNKEILILNNAGQAKHRFLLFTFSL